ncbi:RagB/SusD family nutrient uptake outer membrane protein [Microbacterium lushaniae]|nr:RagB/SusD family nutrient uptake outer membrane protein [Microbacterium lushaniae]
MHVVEHRLLMDATLSEPLKKRERRRELVDRWWWPLRFRVQDRLCDLRRWPCKDLLLFSGPAREPC